MTTITIVLELSYSLGDCRADVLPHHVVGMGHIVSNIRESAGMILT